jgi:ankyrin repeat protein
MDNLPPPPPYAESDPALSPVTNAQPPVYPSTARSSISRPSENASSSSSSSSNVRVTQTIRSSALQSDDSITGDDDSYISGAPYFAMREPTVPRPVTILAHRMNLEQKSNPENTPFPSPARKFSERGLNAHDWSTFLNHVFPMHNIRRTEQIQESQVFGGDEKRTPYRPAPLPRREPEEDASVDLEAEVLRRSRIQRVVEEWNRGLFLPRGIRITTRMQPIPNTVDLEASSSAGETALYKAVTKGDVALVNTLLLRGSNPDAKPYGGGPGICHAASAGRSDIVKLLLSFGGNPDASPPAGSTALHSIASKSNSGFLNFFFPPSDAGPEDVKLIETLLDYGAKVDAAPMGAEPALCKAAGKGYLSLVTLLISRGANVEAKPWGGKTALYSGACRGDLAITKLLLEKGAKVDASPSGCNTALYEAVDKGNVEMVQLLLAGGADINAKRWGGETALCRAIGNGNEAILKLFLEFPKGKKRQEVVGEIRRIAGEKGVGEMFQGREDHWFR